MERLAVTNRFGRSTQILMEKKGTIAITTDIADKKTFVDVHIDTGSSTERHVGSFFHKTFRVPDDAKRFFDKYTLLAENGFPVPTTVRLVEGKSEILMTDLTEGGEKTVFSINEFYLRDFRPPSIHNLTQGANNVQEQLRAIIALADTKQVRIAWNAYFIVVDKEGIANVVLGSFTPTERKTSWYPYDTVENITYINDLISKVQDLRRGLS